MKDSIAKGLPIIVGLAIGWLLFHPPAWLAPLGPARFVLMGLFGLALLVVFVAFTIAASLPAEIDLSPKAGPLDPSMSDLARQIRDLGFVEAGPPYRVEMRPAATMISYVHPNEPVYATIFRTGTVPAVTSFDFVSIIEGFRGGLTTGADWRGGTMPSGPGQFRQIVEGVGPAQAFGTHLEGLRWLRAHGLPLKGISAASFVEDFKRAMVKQRQSFRSSLLKHALIALWRTATRRVPQVGPLAGQKGAEAQARKLATRL